MLQVSKHAARISREHGLSGPALPSRAQPAPRHRTRAPSRTTRPLRRRRRAVLNPPAAPTIADHHRARSPTTRAVPNPSSPQPPRPSRSLRRRCTRPFAPRCLGSPAIGGQCEKSSSARSEVNREVRYETTCDATQPHPGTCSPTPAQPPLRFRGRSASRPHIANGSVCRVERPGAMGG